MLDEHSVAIREGYEIAMRYELKKLLQRHGDPSIPELRTEKITNYHRKMNWKSKKINQNMNFGFLIDFKIWQISHQILK